MLLGCRGGDEGRLLGDEDLGGTSEMNQETQKRKKKST